MKRKPQKPRRRVKWPAEQWKADARVEIDVVLRQDNDPAKIHITTKRDHTTAGDPQKPKPLSLTPEQLAASKANLEAIRDGVKKAAAGEKLEVTPEPDSPSDGTRPEPPEYIRVEPEPLTEAEIKALTNDDEDWFEQVEYVCEKIGIFGCLRWFFRFAGGGAGLVTVYWMVKQAMSQ